MLFLMQLKANIQKLFRNGLRVSRKSVLEYNPVGKLI